MARYGGLPIYERKRWNRAKYKPLQMTSCALDLTQEIKNTSNTLNELSEIMNKIAKEINSYEFNMAVNKINESIVQMNKTVSVNSLNLVNDLTNICDKITQRNQELAMGISKSKSLLTSCSLEIEKIGR